MLHAVGARTGYGSPMPGSPRSRSFGLEDPISMKIGTPQNKDGFVKT